MTEKSRQMSYQGKKVLVTGAAGTVGRELVSQLLRHRPKELRLLDNNETELFFMLEQYRDRGDVAGFLGDVRDRDKLKDMAKGVDIIIHCAAFKHVILSEYNPFDAVQTNIMGVDNVIHAARTNGVRAVLFTSSDKAVNPTNVMGTTKLMGEKLITAANAVKDDSRTIYSSVRFGNVIGSRGSVVPLFLRQIREGGPLTITNENMTRFVMTVEESAQLVLQSLTLARGGEVFVTKMPVVRIPDLAEVLIDVAAPLCGRDPKKIRTTIIGSKPGEKLYEELMSDEERHRALELKSLYVIVPAFKNIYRSISYRYRDTLRTTLRRSYVSRDEQAMTKQQIRQYLARHRVVEAILEA